VLLNTVINRSGKWKVVICKGKYLLFQSIKMTNINTDQAVHLNYLDWNVSLDHGKDMVNILQRI
jgi:hypothetical protein